MIDTRYSNEIEGSDGNYHWPARFRKHTGGYIGIDQTHDSGKIESVLLSPSQVRALMTFIHPGKTAKKRKASKGKAKG